MTRTALSRLKRLEAQRHAPPTMRRHVVRFSPAGVLLDDLPNGTFMAVTHHGTDAEWEECLAEQQRKLVMSDATQLTEVA